MKKLILPLVIIMFLLTGCSIKQINNLTINEIVDYGLSINDSKATKSFKGYIKSNFILEENHPSYYARLGKDMPSDIFHNINKIMKYLYNEKIAWYKEPLYEQ